MKSITKLAVIFALALATLFAGMPNAEAATLRNAAMASANTQKGAKYVWGREGGYSKGYDCSGLTYWAYKRHGKTLSRTAQGQYNKSKHISWGSRKPGDLVFIKDGRGRVYHVGILTRVRNGTTYMVNANYGLTTKHIVGEWPVYNYTYGPSYAVIGRY